jgi:hypothetical protein
MNTRLLIKVAGTAVATAAAAYAAYVGRTWLLYGCRSWSAEGRGADPLLDRFIPEYEVVERRKSFVCAPPTLRSRPRAI